MKKSFLLFAVLLISLSASAQFYISGSGGYGFKAGEKVLGQKTVLSATGELVSRTDLEGSYGNGFNSQLRLGYLLNEKFGFELGIGYLHGADQDVSKTYVGDTELVNIIARARAFGASFSALYNFTDNFYARAGFLTKIGGKTETIGTVNYAPAVTVDFTTDFHGKFPAGFIGAVGYKYPVGDNLNLFAEIEYLGINVTRDTSELSQFSATYAGQEVSRDQLDSAIRETPALNAQFGKLLPLLEDKHTWTEADNTNLEAPYSSVGFNIGITYTFGK